VIRGDCTVPVIRCGCTADRITGRAAIAAGRLAGMPGTRTHGIVFDLDGVLMDSEHWWDEIRREVAANHGGTWRPEATTAMLGMSTPEWSGYLVTALGVRLTPDEVARTVIDEMARRFAQAPPVIPGAVAAVRDAARRAPTAIATSAPPRIVRAFLDGTGLAGSVSATVSSEQVGAGKPDPAVYLEAARLIGVSAADCVAIEDSTNGLRAALAAGMTVIATPNSRFPPDPEVLARASAVIDSVADVGPVLDRLTASW
jgi:HAD superfamily hydrolase (TIGR01509 family)